ncbi:MAG TPA: hypothetical protein VFU46_05335, partial [Gemmatimonadales bacterium]|nr:hypothetical protein [Gemmatimonadales bacterium]
HDRRYALDTRKAVAELGFAPEETFEAGLRKTVRWYLGHETWWRGVMDGSYRDWISRHYGYSVGTDAHAVVARDGGEGAQ